MGRPLRSQLQHGMHHVMNRGVDRGVTFFDDVDRVEFGRLLEEAWRRFGVDVHAYCLMPNHFHLLLACPDGGLSEYMQLVASQYTRHTNDRLGRDGPLFRGRFHSIPIGHDDDYLLRATRYIHRNPLALASVQSPDQYRWSSHRSYLGHRRCPPWLQRQLVLGLFGDDPGSFDAFVSGETAGQGRPISARRLLSVIDLIVDESADRIDRGRQGLSRTVAVLAVAGLGCDDTHPLVRELGLSDPDVRRRSMRRAGQQSLQHPELEPIVNRVIQLAA